MSGRIAIHHQDEHLVVIDKPPGILVVAAPGRSGATLVDRLRQQLQRDVFAVHRLDEETSGAMVFALSSECQTALEGMFRDHQLIRTYLALVTNVPSPPAGRIRSRLAEQGGIVRVVARGGEVAITEYQVLSRRGRCCLVQCRLETGRRNQIRVHMAELGCPVAGDRKYGYRARPGEGFPRVMLHSHRIVFAHPMLGTSIDVIVEAPETDLRP